MHPFEDRDLLHEYVERGSEEAFATLVSRHVNMVYSVALRTVGNPDHAEEVAQVVFLVFARKARSLGPRIVVAGWLFHAARLTASNFIRNEVRRRRRDQEVYMQSQYHEHDAEDVWAQIAPMLDGAIGSLGASDRNAVVLRFLEGRELAEVGRAIGASEEGARKRVHRALEKLRKFFTKRGVILSGTILASAIAANSATAAPTGLAASITAAGALKAATAGASTLALFEGTLKALAWAKLKFAAGIGAGVALAAGTAIVAVTYIAEASHTPNKAPTLSPNSPFVRHLANPPWIKKMEFAQGNFGYAGLPTTNDPPPKLIWQVATNSFAIQPSGAYFMMSSSSMGERAVYGVDDQNYWSASEKARTRREMPVTADFVYGSRLIEGTRPRMEELRHLGLRGLRPGTFAMHEDGSFTAVTLKDEQLEGKILKVSNDRPLALTYHFIRADYPDIELTVNVTYQYASATAPLPASFGQTQIARISQRGFDGREMISTNDGSASPYTNYILKAEYGLDESITRGYSPSMFLPDVDQYPLQTNVAANGVLYINGVAQPSRSAQIGGPGTVTNRAGK
jgi:RNA polymerase sigma factor (sigma-70 family)